MILLKLQSEEELKNGKILLEKYCDRWKLLTLQTQYNYIKKWTIKERFTIYIKRSGTRNC